MVLYRWGVLGDVSDDNCLCFLRREMLFNTSKIHHVDILDKYGF